MEAPRFSHCGVGREFEPPGDSISHSEKNGGAIGIL